MQVKDVIAWMEKVAPTELAAHWDQVGLQVGDPEAEVTGIVVTLDVTDEAVVRAKIEGANLIVAHHPLIFSPLYAIKPGDSRMNRILEAIRSDLNIFVVHTNLDAAAGGVNDVLAQTLELKKIALVQEEHEAAPFMRTGYWKNAGTQEEFLTLVQERLALPSLRVGGKAQGMIYKVAVASGSGSDAIELCPSLGVQVLVTGDVKYHDFQRAAELGILVVDAGHFETEIPIVDNLADRMKEALKLPVYVERSRGFLLETL